MKRFVARVTFFASVLLLAGGQALPQDAPPPKPQPVPAQISGFRAEFLKQLDDVQKKIIDLAQAVPQEKYSWRPAPGVRSVSEVYMHIAGGNWLIVRSLGIAPPAGLSREMEKISDKAKVVENLKQSFEHVRAAMLSKTDADMDKAAKLFGRETTVRDVFVTVELHLHEHLGQSIAYARSVGVVPPWNAGG